MTPAPSSRLIRSRTAGADIPTRRASSAVLIRASSARIASTCRLTASSSSPLFRRLLPGGGGRRAAMAAILLRLLMFLPEDSFDNMAYASRWVDPRRPASPARLLRGLGDLPLPGSGVRGPAVHA